MTTQSLDPLADLLAPDPGPMCLVSRCETCHSLIARDLPRKAQDAPGEPFDPEWHHERFAAPYQDLMITDHSALPAPEANS